MSVKVDIDLPWRGDLGLGPTGDLAVVTSTDLTQQKILRRLLTAPGEYLWSMRYGAGLGQLVGKPIDIRAVEAVVRFQLKHESTVASSPAPQVRTVAEQVRDNNEYVISIKYSDDQSDTEAHLIMDLAG